MCISNFTSSKYRRKRLDNLRSDLFCFGESIGPSVTNDANDWIRDELASFSDVRRSNPLG